MLTVTLVMLSVLSADWRDNFPVQFESLEFAYGEQCKLDPLCAPLRYCLSSPRYIVPGKKYPLLVWLHWNSIKPDPPIKSLRVVFSGPDHPEKYQFFVLALSVASRDTSWFHEVDATDYESASTALANNILEKTMQEHPVDPDRIYLAGLSYGSTRCWEMAMHYPEKFAAIVSTGAGGCNMSQASQLVNIPIWAFHYQNDPNVSPNGHIRNVAAVNAAGGNAYITIEPETRAHDVWDVAFKQHMALNWMLAQRRGAPICWYPPDVRVWKWWHMLILPATFLVFLRLAWIYEERRRRRASCVSSPDKESKA